MKKYEIFDYDVWGNEEEGYNVNDVMQTGKACYTLGKPKKESGEFALPMMGRKERKIIMEKEEYLKNMETADVIFEKIAHLNPCSAWNRGVVRYAMELMNDVDGEEITEKNLLGGADNWKEYSYGGCSLVYDVDICHRLCTPSEIKKTHNGEHRPNKQETWLDTQARALYHAARLILKIKREVER